ncbi:hypothetical protein FH972_015749 [Carpinus fangiana]|uniref:Late embryogenesis abundant protein LEA-2 subgroup domain-containing protein n=1 Tax=Carpinus fangiana TaxID=176857 RepID=A0A5N6REB2_9ROSI|nr:hypothetical protein FH972_015749 [Carpinus fangiana]
MQVTISAKNRMNSVGIYYQKLDVYASYGANTGIPFGPVMMKFTLAQDCHVDV